MTKNCVSTLKVKWCIRNVESWLQDRNDTLYSPQFNAEELGNTRWKLGLSQNWQLAEKYVSLFLQRDVENGCPQLIELNYELSVLAHDESRLTSISFANKFAPKTVSKELNVKQIDILVKEKKDYLPDGVMTVCCRLFNRCSTLSNELHTCLSPLKGLILHSVIGTKRITMKADITNFQPSSSAVVNFLPNSKDISLISLDVFVSFESKNESYEFVFNKKHVECKSVCWYSLKLYAVDTAGQKRKFRESLNLTKSSSIVGSMYEDQCLIPYTMRRYYSNGLLNLKLIVNYHPGVVSETTGSWFNNNETLCTSTDPEITNQSVVEEMSSNISNSPPSTEIGNNNESCLDPVKTSCLPVTTLKDDLSCLYNDRLFCDINLQVDTETFPAHRNILSARSPVFKKMFMTYMKEKPGGCIQVPGISPDTARRMLQFLYTDCPGELDIQSAKDLYVASTTYGIASLKAHCFSFMTKNLHASNVCDVLVLANMHQDKDLESSAQDYIMNNDTAVFCSEEWKIFMKNYSDLAAQMMFLNFTKNR